MQFCRKREKKRQMMKIKRDGEKEDESMPPGKIALPWLVATGAGGGGGAQAPQIDLSLKKPSKKSNTTNFVFSLLWQQSCIWIFFLLFLLHFFLPPVNLRPSSALEHSTTCGILLQF